MTKTGRFCAAALTAGGLLVIGEIAAHYGSEKFQRTATATATAEVGRMQRETWYLKTSTGSGSAIHFQSPKPLPQLLTAAHVVDDVTSNEVVSVTQFRRGPDGVKSFFAVKVRVVWVNKEWDVALLEAATAEGFGIGAVLASKPALVGERLRHVGYFFGTELGESYSEGVVSALDVRPKLPGWPWKNSLDQMILPGLSGSSGGPVFNDRGECSGILVGGVNCVIFVYVPVRQILPLLAPSNLVTTSGR